MISTLSGRFVLAAATLALLGGCSSIRSTFGLDRKPPDEFAVVSRAPLTLPPDFTLPPPAPGAPRPQERGPTQQAASALFGAGQTPTGLDNQPAPVPTALGSTRPGQASQTFSPSLPPAPATPGATQPTTAAGRAAAARQAAAALQTPQTGPSNSIPSGRRGFAQAQPQAPVQPSLPASPGESAFLSQAGAEYSDSSIRQTVNQETAGLLLANRTTVERLLGLAPRNNDQIVNPREESARIRQNAATGAPVTEGETPTIARRRRGLLDGIF